MRIAHIIFSLETGGSETMLVDIINHQATAASIGLFIINNEVDNTLKNKVNKEVSIYYINRKKSSKNLLPILKLNYWLYKFKSDIIHCHNHDVIKALCKSFHKKSYLTIHDTGITVVNMCKYKKLFAISKPVADDVFLRAGLKSTIIQNGIEVNAIKMKKDFSKKDTFKIVQVGRLLHEKKGQHLLIEALIILRNKGLSSITIDFIGEGPSYGYLVELCSRNSLSNSINFLGLQSRDYIYRHLCNYDLLVQPSIYEGFGLTVIEALAANIPVLASANEGPKEILESLNTGYLFKLGSVKDCAAKIEYLMNYQIPQPTVVRKRVSELYSIASTAKKYLEMYAVS